MTEPVPSPPAAGSEPASLPTRCKECSGRLAVMRVIAGREGSEYWAQRCIRCGGIHLDIVDPRGPRPD